jgi:hypothetical protein
VAPGVWVCGCVAPGVWVCGSSRVRVWVCEGESVRVCRYHLFVAHAGEVEFRVQRVERRVHLSVDLLVRRGIAQLVHVRRTRQQLQQQRTHS